MQTLHQQTPVNQSQATQSRTERGLAEIKLGNRPRYTSPTNKTRLSPISDRIRQSSPKQHKGEHQQETALPQAVSELSDKV
jgi:hypothetical protein